MVLLYTSWDGSEDDEKVYKINKEALEKIDSEAKIRNVSSSYRYMNYAFTPQNPIDSYGSESKAHLQAVSAKYDPEGFFQIVGSGPFRISD